MAAVAATSYPNLRSIELPSIRAYAPPDGADRLWCVVCERTFRAHQQRNDEGVFLCAYTGCEGGRLFEPWSWERVRAANPQYPEEPLEDVAYPYFGAAGGAHRDETD